ncbi:polysaccharide deacetylase family protein [Streptomyces violascens]|uniref:polysaccharide deacetylase family protein n=1 Tax=Streptomyces violascens TaxID=67381 RepID=UPI003688998B
MRNGAQDAARAGHRARARPGRPARLRARRRPLPRGGLYDREIRELPATARTVALTFNAAWDEQGLDTVLKVLRQQRASATSFLTGQFAERHPAAARAIAEAGHGIANHSYSPPFGELTPEERAQEITRADRAFRIATGIAPLPFFRFPYATPRPGRSPRPTRSATPTSSGPPAPPATGAPPPE